MNSQKLLVLTIVAVGMVVWAISLAKRDVRPERNDRPTSLVQGLDIDSIGIITIGSGEDQITLERQGKQFVIKDKDSYPASTKQVNDLLNKCLEIKIQDLYSSNAKNHEDLGVTLEKARTVVRFAKTGGDPITGVVVGESRSEGGSGSFVRRTDSNDVYVTPSSPYIRSDVTGYMDQELFTLEKENIATVKVTDPNKLTYTLVSDVNDPETILMSNLPKGKKLQNASARSVFTALTSVRFDDVSRTADPNATFNYEYVATLKDARVYTLKLAVTDDDKVYAQVSAEYTDKVLIDPSKKDDPEELKAKEAKLKTQEKALTFTAKHNGWIYEIPDWKGQYLVKYQDELVEDLPEPEPVAESDVIEAAIQGAIDPNM